MRDTIAAVLREWLLHTALPPGPRMVSAVFLASSGLWLCGAAYDLRTLMGLSGTADGALTVAVSHLFPAPSRD